MKKELYLPAGETEKIRNIYDILLLAKDCYGERTAYRWFTGNGEEASLTFRDFADRVDALRAALFMPEWRGKHFAVIGESCVEWISVYLAVISGVGICVPIDRELNDETLLYQLNYADADALFVTENCLEKIQKLLPSCRRIQDVIIVRSASDYPGDRMTAPDCRVTRYEELLSIGKQLLMKKGPSALPQEIIPEAPCTILFTSGTTGANKGVVLSNKSIVGTLNGCKRLLCYPETDFSVLPIHHAYELHANLLGALYCGTCVSINNEMRYFLKNLKIFRPEMSCMVPAMLDSILRQVKSGIKRSGKEKQFRRMLVFSERLRKIGIDRRRLFFREILDSLGGNLKMIISGGAFLNPETEAFLTGIGIDIYNGYGITECSPVAAVNAAKCVKPGSAGRILPTAEVRIENPDENGNGEIQIYGDPVMLGYYHAEEDTRQVFTEDGWLRTGDLGYVDRDKFLYITGRSKNLIILPNGKNICPEEIEQTLMKKVPFIKECVVTGNRSQTGLFGYIYPDMEYCARESLTKPEDIKAFLQGYIDAFNRGEPGYKRLSDFEIRTIAFEKNTTHKILRYKIGKLQ